MKLLIVAHPDDEIIWFNPESFDLIVIVFCAVPDKPRAEQSRIKAISEHPLTDRIEFLKLPQSAYWRNETRIEQHKNNFQQLEKMLLHYLQKCSITEVFTHNALGEYGHFDHILVHDVVKLIFHYRASIPVWALPIPNPLAGTRVRSARTIETNYELFHAIKDVYDKYDIWTWEKSYLPPSSQEYHLVC
jgi:LmbE family N-acetylglucosaminyl deacetylase